MKTSSLLLLLILLFMATYVQATQKVLVLSAMSTSRVPTDDEGYIYPFKMAMQEKDENGRIFVSGFEFRPRLRDSWIFIEQNLFVWEDSFPTEMYIKVEIDNIFDQNVGEGIFAKSTILRQEGASITLPQTPLQFTDIRLFFRCEGCPATPPYPSVLSGLIPFKLGIKNLEFKIAPDIGDPELFFKCKSIKDGNEHRVNLYNLIGFGLDQKINATMNAKDLNMTDVSGDAGVEVFEWNPIITTTYMCGIFDEDGSRDQGLMIGLINFNSLAQPDVNTTANREWTFSNRWGSVTLFRCGGDTTCAFLGAASSLWPAMLATISAILMVTVFL